MEPSASERITTFSIDGASSEETFIKQDDINWHIFYTNQDKMVDSQALERVQSYLGLQTVPEMLFGDS